MFPSICEEKDHSSAGAAWPAITELADCIECYVEEERNGLFELSLTYPIGGIGYDFLKDGAVILAKPNATDTEQPFRIYSVEADIGQTIAVKAMHFFLDSVGVLVNPTSTIASTLTAACTLLRNQSLIYPQGKYTVSAAQNRNGTFQITETDTLRRWISGRRGSLIDVYGGELHYDDKTCYIETARGRETGVKAIEYGVNMLDFSLETNSANAYNGARAYWKSEDGTLIESSTYMYDGTEVTSYRDLQDVARVKFAVLDFSSYFQEAPTLSQINNRLLTYIAANKIAEISESMDLDFVQLQTEQLDTINLCDVVPIIYSGLGVTVEKKCIQTKWNVLLDRYDSVKIGLTESISGTIGGMVGEESNNLSPIFNQINSRLDALERRVTTLEG